VSERKILYTFGRKRKPEYVRVFKEAVDGETRVRVQFKRSGRLKTESFPDTRKGIAEAKAFAEGVHESLQLRIGDQPDPLTVGDLWEKYVTAKIDAWRPATLRNKNVRWRLFELYVGKQSLAQHVTRETLDGFKRTLIATPTRGKAGSKHPRAINQVRQIIDNATMAFRWAVDRDLIPPTKVASYVPEFSRDAKMQTVEMAEFGGEERAKVLAHLDPRNPRQWRPWALTVLFAHCAPRMNAALHLSWDDVDFEAGTILWRSETDKRANERIQPMPAPVIEALWVAYGWRMVRGYDGPFVFFAAKGTRREAGKPYAHQPYLAALHKAEQRAGLTPVRYKGSHAFRRGVAGDIHARTGSSKKAADWIGDKSVRIVDQHYLLERQDELRKTAVLIAEPNQTQRTLKRSDSEES
jgi:integrase